MTWGLNNNKQKVQHLRCFLTFLALAFCACMQTKSLQLCLTLWTVACQAPLSMGFSRLDTGVGCHALLQGIFPTQGSKLHLLHWQVGSLPLVSPRKPLTFWVDTKSESSICILNTSQVSVAGRHTAVICSNLTCGLVNVPFWVSSHRPRSP